MRRTHFQIVLLVGFMFVASSASAQRGPGGGRDGEHERGGVAVHAGGSGTHVDAGRVHVDAGRPAVRVDAGRAAVHVDAGRAATRVDGGRPAAGVINNDGQRRAGSFGASPQRQNSNFGRSEVRVNPRVNIGGSRANISGPNAWRYRQHNNQWWYWMPNNSWAYWNNGAWVPYGAYGGLGYSNGYNGPYASGYRGTNSFGGGYLGVSFDAQSGNVAVISQVNANSPAQAAGLQPGDVVRAINGQEIHSAFEPSRMIGQYAPGTQVTLSIERNQQVSDVPVVLGQI